MSPFDALTRVIPHAGPSMVSTVLKGMLLALIATVSWLGVSKFAGNSYLFLLFDVSFLALAALALPRPRLYWYTFIAAMLFLGFWMKMMMHLIFGTAFLEPIGAFDGSPQSWDRALGYASMAAIGACLARGVHLWLARQRERPAETADAPTSPAPQWYAPLRARLWIGSFALLFLLNALNFQVAFYQTGINSKLILPLHLNVVAGWLVNIGFALWFACLIHWDFSHAPNGLARTLLAPVVEALSSSTSALSRSFYLIHTVPYYFALVENWTLARGLLTVRTRAALVLVWALGFVLSLSVVTWLRIHFYDLGYTPTYITNSLHEKLTGASTDVTVSGHQGKADVNTDPTKAGASTDVTTPGHQGKADVNTTDPTKAGASTDVTTPGHQGKADVNTDAASVATPVGPMIWRPGGGEILAGATIANRIGPMAQQVSSLFIGRWTGLEGTLAVSAYHDKNLRFFLQAMRESPTKGNDSIYQKIVKSSYTASKAFTFLTLAGFVAILAYSGSLLVVLTGAALAVLLAIVTEIAGSRLTGNPLLLSVAGCAMANVLCQTNFPYLTAVFFVELWITLVFIWGLQALPRRTIRASTARHR